MKKLIIILLCIGMIFSVGCQKDIPEGVSEEFYDEMIESSEYALKLLKDSEGMSNQEVTVTYITSNIHQNYIKKYEYNEDLLSQKEKGILDSYSWIIDCIAMSKDSDFFKKVLRKELQTFSDLMNLNYEVDNLIK